MDFKVCVIGCGWLSTRVHGPSLRHYADLHPDVVLAGCCDLATDKAETYRQQFGFQNAYTDFGEMLAKEEPDAVCLMAPVERTCELSVAIMERGYPLLLEKPPGLNRDECLKMIEAAQKSGVPNQVSFNRRYTPLVVDLKQRVRELLKDDEVPVQDIRYDFFRINRRDADFSTTAIHGIDTIRFLADSDFAEVSISYQNLPKLGDHVANIFLECRFRSGAMGHINFCPVTGVLIERATLTLQDHTFFLQIPVWGAYDSPGRLQHVCKGKLIADIAGVEDTGEPGNEGAMYIASGFYGENAAFLDDLRAGRRPCGDIRSGLQSVEVADCIRRRDSRCCCPE